MTDALLGFLHLQAQNLTADLDSYPEIIMNTLQLCGQQPEEYCAVFLVREDGDSTLLFVQNLMHKMVEVR